MAPPNPLGARIAAPGEPVEEIQLYEPTQKVSVKAGRRSVKRSTGTAIIAFSSEVSSLGDMVIDLIGLDDPIWDSWLEYVQRDVYHEAAYVRASQGVDEGTGFGIGVRKEDGVLFLPLVRREIQDGYWDAVSPYGYCGPAFSSNSSLKMCIDLLQVALDQLRQIGCVSVFVRQHPAYPCKPYFLAQPSLANVSSSQTVVIDLTSAASHRWQEMSKVTRYDIRRAIRNGYSYERDISCANLEEFSNLYRRRMSELQASKSMFFDDSYFAQLRHGLGEAFQLHLVRFGGEIVAGSVVLASGQWAHYHLAAMDVSHRAYAPSKLLLFGIEETVRGLGLHWLHLGGGRGGAEDGLFAFKSSFSPLRLDYATMGLILMPEMYSQLLRDRAGSELLDFFPAYRAPR